MKAIFKKEIKNYFISPVGYAFLLVFSLISAALLTIEILFATNTTMSEFFSNFFTNLIMVLMFLIPILTMKLFSEEKKGRTDQILFTSPVSTTSIVMGKFLAALCIFAIALFITGIYVVIISLFSKIDILLIMGNYLGIILVGAAFISIGMFFSTMTENQVIAAIISFAAMLAFLLIHYLKTIVTGVFVNVVEFFSVIDRYMDFNEGLLNPASILFFLTISAVFVYLTVRVLEKRRLS